MGALLRPRGLHDVEKCYWNHAIGLNVAGLLTPCPQPFTARYACDSQSPMPVSFDCDGGTGIRFGATTSNGAPAVEVTIGGRTSAPQRLPTGATLIESCGRDAVCCLP